MIITRQQGSAFQLALLSCCIWFISNITYSTPRWSESDHHAIPWVFNQEELSPSIQLPTKEAHVEIQPSRSWLKKRLNPKQKSGIEPLKIWIKKSHINQISKKLARKAKASQLAESISHVLEKTDKKAAYVDFTKIHRSLWNKEQVLKHFRKKHLKVELQTDKITTAQFNKLITQLLTILPKKDVYRIKKHYQRKKAIHLDHHMLPKFVVVDHCPVVS